MSIGFKPSYARFNRSVLHADPALVKPQPLFARLRSLRYAVLAALVVGFGLLVGVQYFVIRAFVVQQLLEIEASDAFKRLADLHHAVEVLKEDLASTTNDWSQWDEPFAYATHANTDFADANLDPGTIARLRLSFVIIIDDRGEPLFAKMLAPDRKSLIDAPSDMVALARARGALANPDKPREPLTGFVASSAGVFVFSSQPVLKSIEPSAPSGRVIMARSLEAFVAPALRRVSGAELQAQPLEKRTTSRLAPQRVRGRDALSVREHDILGTTPIDDVWGRPVAQLQAIWLRTAQAWFAQTQRYVLGAAVVIGLLFCIAALALLRHGVVAPLEAMAFTVARIGQDGDTAARLPSVRGAREFEMLSSSINQMLAQLDQQQAIRRDRDAAVAANRLKSDFLATMSHEIRTPMNGVLGMCELLQRTDLNPRQRHLSDTIVRSARSLLDILNDILDFSKIESGKLELEQAVFAPDELVQTACAPFVASAFSKGLTFTTRVASDVPAQLVGDPLRLRQVLNNLLSNALKFTECGSVSLACTLESARGEDVELRFSVSDTGIGVARELQTRIFEPFAQADVNTSRCYGGTGLGLAIVRRLVTLMGGQVSVRTADGGGAEFSFTMRLKRASARQSEALPPLDATGPHFSTANAPAVLLAEDNAVNREVLTEMLEHFGCRVTAVENGAEALAKAAEARFDVVLMDCHMPVMDGCTAAAEWRALERAEAQTPTFIIALTADVTIETRLRCLEAGMNEVVAKPVSHQSLRDLVMHAFAYEAGAVATPA